MTTVHIAPAAATEQAQEQRAACGVDDDDGDDVKKLVSIDGMGGQEGIQDDGRRSTRLSSLAFITSLMECLLP